mmetsp:Transcript_5950/g.18788  ORF Transcript_5950/g.18788 Transcript_5950/m.18788 type:complete len:445 (+) Transcript_5950:736-2070(+)
MASAPLRPAAVRFAVRAGRCGRHLRRGERRGRRASGAVRVRRRHHHRPGRGDARGAAGAVQLLPPRLLPRVRPHEPRVRRQRGHEVPARQQPRPRVAPREPRREPRHRRRDPRRVPAHPQGRAHHRQVPGRPRLRPRRRPPPRTAPRLVALHVRVQPMQRRHAARREDRVAALHRDGGLRRLRPPPSGADRRPRVLRRRGRHEAGMRRVRRPMRHLTRAPPGAARAAPRYARRAQRRPVPRRPHRLGQAVRGRPAPSPRDGEAVPPVPLAPHALPVPVLRRRAAAGRAGVRRGVRCCPRGAAEACCGRREGVRPVALRRGGCVEAADPRAGRRGRRAGPLPRARGAPAPVLPADAAVGPARRRRPPRGALRRRAPRPVPGAGADHHGEGQLLPVGDAAGDDGAAQGRRHPRQAAQVSQPDPVSIRRCQHGRKHPVLAGVAREHI